MVAWQQHRQNKILSAVDESCREAVTEYAKYTGGVSFPHDLEFTQSDRSRDLWMSDGAVDFPNGWGTPVRQGFSCLIGVEGTEVTVPLALVESRDED